MKKSVKNVLVCLLLIAMTVSLFGCAGNGGNGGNNVIEHEGGVIGGDNAELSYPLNTDVELNMWTVYSPLHQSYTDESQSPWHSGLEEKTGVKVNWQWPVPGADESQAFSLLMTNEELPDLIGWGVTPGEAAQLIYEDAIIDLTPFLPIYAPDYWAYINEEGHEDRLRAVSTDDGKVFMIGSFSENEYNSCAYGPVVRKDWLDACGLDIPVTMADWEEMLTAFNQKYGAKFSTPENVFRNIGLASGTGAYASYTPNFYLDNGEIKYTHTQPEYKEYLATLRRWTDNGLFDKDNFKLTEANFRTKAMNNQVGATYVVNSLYTKMLADAATVKNGANWIPVPYPVPEEGDTAKMIAFRSNNLGSGVMISTSCPVESIPTALRWLNYGFSEEGLIYYNYGEEGLHHVKDAQGNITYTSLVMNDPEGPTMSTQKYTSSGAASASMPTLTFANTVFQKNNPMVKEAVTTWLTNQEAKEHILPEYALTREERAQSADYGVAVKTLASETAQRMIIGYEDVDNFDNMVKEAYQLGLQELLDINNAAYQRYLNRIAG